MPSIKPYMHDFLARCLPRAMERGEFAGVSFAELDGKTKTIERIFEWRHKGGSNIARGFGLKMEGQALLLISHSIRFKEPAEEYYEQLLKVRWEAFASEVVLTDMKTGLGGEGMDQPIKTCFSMKRFSTGGQPQMLLHHPDSKDYYCKFYMMMHGTVNENNGSVRLILTGSEYNPAEVQKAILCTQAGRLRESCETKAQKPGPGRKL